MNVGITKSFKCHQLTVIVQGDNDTKPKCTFKTTKELRRKGEASQYLGAQDFKELAKFLKRIGKELQYEDDQRGD